MKEYYDNKSDLEKLKFACWALTWGQCADIVKKKLKALTICLDKERTKDVAWLLQSLRKNM